MRQWCCHSQVEGGTITFPNTTMSKKQLEEGFRLQPAPSPKHLLRFPVEHKQLGEGWFMQLYMFSSSEV